ncbi:hypothetical protein HYH03_018009 [Edaphochlamys debaryana]|uniref:GST C-terminal domain-containing protein n=1 Tax=Edaphochlamys debaryana TaxID=47281 RepID=A0A835XGU0_9CHLO|nr:hypothetical protein HYH03_018009 [Edaphochlamys debaryana]|eukprot:KAG2483119.1 hypothetical protein HYH03_018009 [Edaphochlamys debaryana]
MATEEAKPALPPNFTHKIEQGTRFEPEAARYHLYVSLGCPFACRCLTAMYLKGLDHAIGVSVTHPTWQRTRPEDDKDEHLGWVFRAPTDPPLSSSTGHGSFGCEGCVPDDINGAITVRQLYDMAGGTSGKYSVPVLWDKKEKTIVNNESAEIIRIFNTAFNAVAKHPEVDLYPEGPLRAAIDDANDWTPSVFSQVYGCGFATTQEAYDKAVEAVFGGLDRCEEVLSKQRYIAGSELSEVDIKLFQSLIRFDSAYYILFKACKRAIRDYPNISGYVRDLYSNPAFSRTVDMYHIRVSYFGSMPALNPYAIVPAAGEPWWEQPSDRAERFGAAKH